MPAAGFNIGPTGPIYWVLMLELIIDLVINTKVKLRFTLVILIVNVSKISFNKWI